MRDGNPSFFRGMLKLHMRSPPLHFKPTIGLEPLYDLFTVHKHYYTHNTHYHNKIMRISVYYFCRI
ncbi:hypothetical protein EDD55_11416 [Varunaivibrio sulfuroxidans]|uniref:Uncharacterized protein n=1 Tax=Varunaivibrio sulfuroxidans TaxID=1773489 RepID=A0A4R3J416_9PROT|nr:hypothetical protein EDD55_11416 [Varunaivibrio sulfuroxidans]